MRIGTTGNAPAFAPWTRSFLMALDAGGGGHCLLVETDSGTFTRAFRAWTHPAAPGTGGLGADLDLEMIWTRLAEAAREAMQIAGAAPEQIAGIAATSMRHTTVVLDADPAPADLSRDVPDSVPSGLPVRD